MCVCVRACVRACARACMRVCVCVYVCHRLSRVLLTCPAQVHFRLLTCSITSVTFVFSLTHMFVFLSWYDMFNILLSIFVCVAVIACFLHGW